MLTIPDSYRAVRDQAGLYLRGRVLTLRGPERAQAVQRLSARSTEFAASQSSLHTLLLDADGAVRGQALLLLLDDEIVTAVDADEEWFGLARDAIADLDAELDEDGRVAVAIEGPRSWEAVATVGESDIADLLLDEVVPGQVDGVPVWLTRAGTTAEFGYVVVGPEQIVASLRDIVAELGGEVDPVALDRLRLETNYPLLPAQVADASVLEAGLGWLVGLTREDDFLGDVVRDTPAPQRRCVAAFAATGTAVVGEPVEAEGKVVGRVQVATVDAGTGHDLLLLLLDDPYGVPGLELSVAGSPVSTVSRPTLAPVSWSSQLGVRA